jgi:hypothetical protein
MATAVQSPESLPDFGRSLLLPGAQAPLSHLGATLLRHVVATGLRYSCYQLGLPMPDGPPVRILRLRLFLDRGALESVLGEASGGGEIVAALLDPGGAGGLPGSALKLRVAAGLHRRRLRTIGPRSRRPRVVDASGGRADIWRSTKEVLAARMPFLSDLVLWEMLESLERRRRRARGEAVAPASGEQAARWWRGGQAELACLGLPDVLRESWQAGEPVGAREAAGAFDEQLEVGGRGAFREGYRRVLSEVRPAIAELGRQAAAAGLVNAADDVFFLPFDLTEKLAEDRPGAWVQGAVDSNRRELESLLLAAEHDDRIFGPQERSQLHERMAQWPFATVMPVD